MKSFLKWMINVCPKGIHEPDPYICVCVCVDVSNHYEQFYEML